MRNKHFIKMAVLTCAALFFGACSSCSEVTTEEGKNGEKTEVITPKEAKTGKTSNSNTNAAPQLKKFPGVKDGENPTLDPKKVKKIDMSKVQKGVPAKKMPDNSEMTTTMKGRYFLETRRFLNHPKLERLERLSKSAKDIEITVYLRNGKSVKVAEGKIKNYKTDTASSILTAIGVTPVKTEAEKKKAAEETRKQKEAEKKAREG